MNSHDARLVSAWADQLRSDLAFDASIGRTDRDAESKLDLFRRGLDPQEERKFRGRISLTVRCEPRKHLLGYVYPTAFLPVFVPSVSAVRSSLLEHKARRTPAWPSDIAPELKATFKKDPEFIRGHGPARDTWIEEDHVGGARSHHITGLTVVHDHDQAPTHQRPPFIDLFCRCGKRRLRKSALRDAVKQGSRILVV